MNIKVIFFDLFYTLIVPKYTEDKNEYDVLGLTYEEWEKYAENEEIYEKRAIGKVSSKEEIMSDITNIIPFSISQEQRVELIHLRSMRMKNALFNVESYIINTIDKIRKMGIKTCLISNADTIDIEEWENSALAKYFDGAVFSCKVGCLKPNKEIYNIAMDLMNVDATQCVFVGDGGSNELKGAKALGMTTIFSEYLDKKSQERYLEIKKYSDFHIADFSKLIDIISKL